MQALRRRAGGLVWGVPVGLQLSLIYALLLAIVLAVLGWALYSQLDGFFVQNTAERLGQSTQSSLAQPLFAPRGRGGREAPRSSSAPPNEARPPAAAGREQLAAALVRALSSSDVDVAVLEATGTVITSTQPSLGGEPPTLPALPQDWQSSLVKGSNRWILSPPGGERRLVLVTSHMLPATQTAPATEFYVEQSASLAAADAVLNQLRLYLLLGIVLGTVLGVVAGLALTRIVLRPLDRMSKTAEAISAGDLGRRLRLPPGRNEVARLGNAFDAMVDRLASALEAQRRFIADASHELRTPLTSLEGMSEMLLMGADRGDTRVVQRTLRSMHGEMGRLSRIVTDLLTLSRLDSTAPMKLVPVDACRLLAEVAEQLGPMSAARDVRLEVSCAGACVVQGEPDKLKQVLLNLVDNALRYTPARGQVCISVSQAQGPGLGLGPHEGGGVQISVQDTGPGIPSADLPHVFDRFYRGDVSRARATGNSGLGLAIARAIVQAHGGTIKAESPAGEGARFTVALP